MLKLKPMRVLLVFFLLIFPLHFSQAESLIQDEAVAYREEGLKLQAMGDFEGALGFYQKAAHMDPTMVQAYNDAGVVYESIGNDQSAEQMYLKALEKDPRCGPAHTNLALLYEKQGNIRKATDHWKARYELGDETSYWWEQALQHLLKLGTYPQVRKEILETQAARLSREIIFKREQERIDDLEQAKHHMRVGNQAFAEGDYEISTEEFRKALSLIPMDDKLVEEALNLYKRSERFLAKERVAANAKSALDYMKDNDYSSAKRRLEEALDAVSRIAQEQ